MAQQPSSTSTRPAHKVRFFFYGQLMRRGPFTAAVRGELRHREHRDAMARFSGVHRYSGLVYGQTRWVNAKLVPHLVRSEAPQYKPVRVRLADGSEAIAFEYAKSNFEEHTLYPDGKFRGPREG